MDLYDKIRLLNIAGSILVQLLAARALIRSGKHLSPSERLILMVVGGYAACIGLGSGIAIHNDAKANEAQVLAAVIQVWAIVAFLISPKRSSRLTER